MGTDVQDGDGLVGRGGDGPADQVQGGQAEQDGDVPVKKSVHLTYQENLMR